MPPKVSVIMSVYNGERYLREAVDSILSQTFTDFEFIIIDDGSRDSTWALLSSYDDPRIHLERNEENIGLTRSLNKGLMLAQGEYIARQDADDVSLPERLGTQIEYLRGHPDVGLLGTTDYVVNSEGRRLRIDRQPSTDTEIRWQMLFHNAFCHSSVMFRREFLDAEGLFYSENLQYSQDYDLWARMLLRTRSANLTQPLVEFRVHEASIEATHRGQQQHIASLIASRQISELLPNWPLKEDEVNGLRQWYYRFPKQLTQQDIALCRLLLTIVKNFQRRPNIDLKVLRDLRRHWIGRILGAFPILRQRGLWKCGLLGAIAREDFLSMLRNVPRLILLRIGRGFQETG